MYGKKRGIGGKIKPWKGSTRRKKREGYEPRKMKERKVHIASYFILERNCHITQLSFFFNENSPFNHYIPIRMVKSRILTTPNADENVQ